MLRSTPPTSIQAIHGQPEFSRGRISGSESRAGSVVIKAQVPFAEMLSYANELISMTRGRGSYSMEFSHYDFVPGEIAEKVIAAHKPHHAGEEEHEAATA